MYVGQVAAGKILVAAGESGSEMFFLVEGQMDVRTGRSPMISAITVYSLRVKSFTIFPVVA